MTIVFRRALPWVLGAAAGVAAYWQWHDSASYPLPLLAFLLIDGCAVIVLAWKRLSWFDGFEKTLPSVLTLSVLALRFLLVETDLERWIITLLFIGISYLILELLFLMIYSPVRYPVNGLSRVNIALVPVAAFFFASTLNGLSVFLRLPPLLACLSFGFLGGCLYLFTAHPSADRSHRWRWAGLGALIGFQAALLGIILPVGMMVQGALAALLMAFPLRLRRYAYQPVPSRRLAWSEGIAAIVCFVVILSAARWI